MAVPTKYNPKRLVDYVGRRSGGRFDTPRFQSGRVSGPRAGANPYGGSNVKLMASLEKAQKKQEGLMAGIAKAETDTFKRLNDALNASKESDPKDKLGNTVPSAQTQYLEQRLIGHMANRSQRGAVLTPGGAGITPGQEKKIAEEGPYIPGAPGTSGLPQPGAVPKPTATGLKPPSVTPIKGQVRIHVSGAEVILTGEQRQGPQGLEIEATVDGKKGWIPEEQLTPVEGDDDQGGLAQLRKYFAPKPVEFPVGP